MISPHRSSKSFIEGRDSAIATRCTPQRAECRYYRNSAQYNAYQLGWNSIFKNFRKILANSNKAQKYADV